MSDHDQDEKTEEPTEKRREELRDKGDVAKSQDLASVVALAAGVSAVLAAWQMMTNSLTHFASGTLGHMEMHSNYAVFFSRGAKATITLIAPILITAVILGIGAQVAQVGLKVSFKSMEFNPNKFNPLPKIKSMFFSKSTVYEILKSLVKIGIIGSLSFSALTDELANNGRLIGLTPLEILSKIGSMCLHLVLIVIIALAFIAILDILIERWRTGEKHKMTKDEVKQEHKNADGDPQTKARIRGKQREMALSRMRGTVAEADVVVVNPTHYSVAIQYNVAKHEAPIIIAAGVDRVAAEIRAEARHNNIPVVSDPPLARALFKEGKVGRPIPRELFSAVASLLAWVYKVTGRM